MKRKLAVAVCALITVGLVLYLAPPAKTNLPAPPPAPGSGSRVVLTPDGKLVPLQDTYGSVLIVSDAKVTNNNSASKAVQTAK